MRHRRATVHPEHPGERSAGIATPASAGVRVPVRELPDDQIGLREHVGENPAPGTTAVIPKSGTS
jgi:hypothetical protein